MNIFPSLFISQVAQLDTYWAIFKTRNGESGNRNGERGIFKSGNLYYEESLKAGVFKMGIFKSGNL